MEQKLVQMLQMLQMLQLGTATTGPSIICTQQHLEQLRQQFLQLGLMTQQPGPASTGDMKIWLQKLDQWTKKQVQLEQKLKQQARQQTHQGQQQGDARVSQRKEAKKGVKVPGRKGVHVIGGARTQSERPVASQALGAEKRCSSNPRCGDHKRVGSQKRSSSRLPPPHVPPAGQPAQPCNKSSPDPGGSEEQNIRLAQSAAYEEDPHAPSSDSHQTRQGTSVHPGQGTQSPSSFPRLNCQDHVGYVHPTLSPTSTTDQTHQETPADPGQGTRSPSSSLRLNCQDHVGHAQPTMPPTSTTDQTRQETPGDPGQGTRSPSSSRRPRQQESDKPAHTTDARNQKTLTSKLCPRALPSRPRQQESDKPANPTLPITSSQRQKRRNQIEPGQENRSPLSSKPSARNQKTWPKNGRKSPSKVRDPKLQDSDTVRPLWGRTLPQGPPLLLSASPREQ
eukprot:gene8277-1546_t